MSIGERPDIASLIRSTLARMELSHSLSRSTFLGALNDGLSWTALRGLGNSTFAKLSMLAPVFGHLILFNENIFRFLAELNWMEVNSFPGGVSTLYCLYLGLFCMGIASAVYQARCHDVVKRYFDEDEFVRAAGPIATRRDLQQYLNVIERTKNSQHLDFDARLARQQFENQAGAIDGLGGVALRNDIMKAYYMIRARDRSVSRVIATLLYLCAFAFLAVPSATTFLRVLVLLIRA